MANSSAAGNGTGAYTGGIPLNVTLHAWPIPKLDTNSKQFNETSPGIDKISESAKNYTNSLHNLNATGYVAIDDDLTDTGFTDVQTFILAGIATVIPLLVIVVTILGVRFIWRRYRARKGDGYEGVLQKEESSEPLGKLQSYSLPQELKTSESQFTVTPGEDVTSMSSPQLLTPKSNGSVITMTLKNNHLIVETEETSNTPTGIKIESKGTTTKFVTSKAPDFRLNVANNDPRTCSKDPSSPRSPERNESSGNMVSSTDHGALVHCPPEETEDELDKGSCNTGLSQSDLSVSSTESQNPSYRYGNQLGYDSGGYGYPEYSGYSTNVTQSQTHQSGPKIQQIYTRSSSIIEPANSYSTECQPTGAPLKDILMSDIQAHERRIEDKKKCEDEQKNLEENKTQSATNGNSSSSIGLVENIKEPQTKQLKKEVVTDFDKNEQLPNNGVNETSKTYNES